MQRNVEKYMGWTIVIYGAPNVSGKRPAPDLAKRLRKKCEETNRHQKNISSINFEKNQWEKNKTEHIYEARSNVFQMFSLLFHSLKMCL